MTSFLARLCAAGTCAVLLAGTAVAQESTNRVAAETDWSVFVENDPTTECWIVSAPKETVNTRDGRVVAVRRGDILLFVSYRPEQNVAGEVAFTGGYPFRDGSTVTLTIGESRFDFFTEGEYAWPGSPEEDAKIIEAMKSGSRAKLTGVSSRGTQTEDTFSLLGFTAMVDEAARRCANPS